jgi:hypothetical protein
LASINGGSERAKRYLEAKALKSGVAMVIVALR